MTSAPIAARFELAGLSSVSRDLPEAASLRAKASVLPPGPVSDLSSIASTADQWLNHHLAPLPVLYCELFAGTFRCRGEGAD